MVVALCFTESSLNYKANHSIKSVKGICGIDTRYFGDILNQQNININSLKAGEVTLRYFLNKNDNDLYQALIEYKGIVKNIYLVDNVLEISNKFKENI